MSTIACVSDVHGERVWKEIVKQESGLDRIVFMGDYFDPYRNISFKDMLSNFNKIIDFKKMYPEQVTLLLGNHDHHYLPGCSDRLPCARFMPDHATELRELFKGLLDLFQICHLEDGYLFSHAGVTNAWAESNKVDTSTDNIQDSINSLYFNHHDYYDAFQFYYNDWSMYGNHIVQSPFWVRPVALASDRVEGYTHVIGHTSPLHYEKHLVEDFEKNSIIMTDTCSQCPVEPIDGLRHSYYYKFIDEVKTTVEVEW